MSGFSGFVHFSPLYYSSRMAAADLSMAQAERNPLTTGQVTLVVEMEVTPLSILHLDAQGPSVPPA